MKMFTGLIVALGAAGIAIAAPAMAQDMHRDTPASHPDMAPMHQDQGLTRHDMPGMHADDERAARRNVATHDDRGMHNGRHWGHRNWRHHRHCRTIWRHHHRVRRCW